MDAISATVLGGTALAGGRAEPGDGTNYRRLRIVFLADEMVMMGVVDLADGDIKGVVIVSLWSS